MTMDFVKLSWPFINFTGQHLLQNSNFPMVNHHYFSTTNPFISADFDSILGSRYGHVTWAWPIRASHFQKTSRTGMDYPV